MIRNILFDMGNVLIRFDPDRFMNDLGCTEKEKKVLMSELFRSIDWVASDRGLIDEEELIRRACKRTDPSLHDKIRELANHWHRKHLMIEGSEELVSELYENGYELYLLTNAALRHHIYWPQYPVSRYFPPERVFLSADQKYSLRNTVLFRKNAYSSMTAYSMRKAPYTAAYRRSYSMMILMNCAGS